MDERARVVVGVDGSACARTALEFALEEAARRDAVLDVVSVALTSEYWPVGIGMASSGVAVPAREQVVEAVQREAEQLVTDVVGERGAAAARVDVRVRAVPGPPAATLIEQARGADLLVVGHRGRGGFASAMLGSVSLHCVLNAACPVTIVRPSPQPADGNG
ncbi:MAG: universal stress protein [Pseudonocardiales bacterium]|nr:universal stress protein [Pseudonocardiales bacterium]